MGDGPKVPPNDAPARRTVPVPADRVADRPGNRPSHDEGTRGVHRHRALRDAYKAARNTSDLIRRVLTPQIVGRDFKVEAMREHGRQVRETGREPPRILRDGRLVFGKVGKEGKEEAKTREAEQKQAVKAGEEKLLFAPAKTAFGGVTAGKAGEPAETAEATPPKADFEKTFLAHFEGEIPIVSEILQKGEFKFLPKTQKAWAEFFQKFAAFALLKTVKAGDVQSLVFRGLMNPDGTLTKEGKALLAQSKAVLVSDLKFTDGKTDKFARLSISSDALLQILSKLSPGDVLTPEVFAELVKAMGGESSGSAEGGEFSYLALSHKIVNPDMAKSDPNAATQAYQSPERMKELAMREGAREATPGIALSAKTEQLVAERLDIDLRSRSEAGLDRRVGEARESPGLPASPTGLFGKKKKRSSLWGGGADEEYDGGSVFVPWYQHVFRPQRLKGKPRWWVAFLYAISGSAALLAAYYVFRFWMQL